MYFLSNWRPRQIVAYMLDYLRPILLRLLTLSAPPSPPLPLPPPSTTLEKLASTTPIKSTSTAATLATAVQIRTIAMYMGLVIELGICYPHVVTLLLVGVCWFVFFYTYVGLSVCVLFYPCLLFI